MIDILIERESKLFSYEFCNNIEQINDILHQDFMEYGTSGRSYNKQQCINFLKDLKTDRNIEIYHASYRELSDNSWILNYVSKDNDNNIVSNRTSIWIKEENTIQLLFHQGTEAFS
ncbi:DUF4440 domain-containing protein [Macrococcoides caseolyticum]|uniref:DUF4440 domain-containing protein n=2 Tax=Macrococcoides caseolyticum TaxID=69966 RepID=B9E924_MACCJ|nr:DUF4440 domain-containing protein [Macrococcus caseolyticus]PKE16679.1 ribonuclease H [Macrococcus caseolyticus]PKE67172.1 ribonuclease H [Macrococcus caseolyticus]BAH16735.1 conserved hypothetical protein [Macrococcus caseolyticus JCSC5402]BAI83371.1 conserved hypothetical protein [Macrococcus caseolyticus]